MKLFYKHAVDSFAYWVEKINGYFFLMCDKASKSGNTVMHKASDEQELRAWIKLNLGLEFKTNEMIDKLFQFS